MIPARKILVTGATRGIGRVMVTRFADLAVPYLLALGPQDNGRSQRIPGS